MYISIYTNYNLNSLVIFYKVGAQSRSILASINVCNNLITGHILCDVIF